MADDVRMEWNAPLVMNRIEADVRRRITAACIIVANRAKQLLSTSGVMSKGDVEEAAKAEPGFEKQFNKNRAYRMRKGKKQGLHMTRGRVHSSRNYKPPAPKAKP